MIGLDTNVIARFVLQDDPTQSPIVNRLFESFSKDEPGFVSLVSVIELVWVMRSSRRAEPQEILKVLDTLLRIDTLVVEQSALIRQAQRSFANANADFADCVIERLAHAAECEYTVTFDRKAVSAGMKLLF